MPQNLVLGSTCLDDYVSAPVAADESRIQEINRAIRDIGGRFGLRVWNVEEAPLRQLAGEKQNIKLHSKYPEISPEFLTMSNKLPYSNPQGSFELRVPRFGVYAFGKEGFNSCDICFERYFGSTHVDYISICEGNLPSILDKPLLMSTDLGQYFRKRDGNSYVQSSPIPSHLTNVFSKITGGLEWSALRSRGELELRSSFHGIIPKEVKYKIKREKKVFCRGDSQDYTKQGLFLVAETQPRDWTADVRIQTDPLIIGVVNNRAYLVDHFDSTPLEYQVRKEFTS